MENLVLQEIKKLSKAMSELLDVMNQRFERVELDLGEVKSELEEVKSDLNVIKRSMVTMETDHGKKLQDLLDVTPDVHTDNIKIKARLEEIDKTLEDYSMVIEIVKETILKGQHLEQA